MYNSKMVSEFWVHGNAITGAQISGAWCAGAGNTVYPPWDSFQKRMKFSGSWSTCSLRFYVGRNHGSRRSLSLWLSCPLKRMCAVIEVSRDNHPQHCSITYILSENSESIRYFQRVLYWQPFQWELCIIFSEFVIIIRSIKSSSWNELLDHPQQQWYLPWMSKSNKISVECRFGFITKNALCPKSFSCIHKLVDHFSINFPDYKLSIYMPVDHEAIPLLCDWYNSDNPPVTSQHMVPYTFGHALITLQAMLPYSHYTSSHASVTLPFSQLHLSTLILSFLTPSPPPSVTVQATSILCSLLFE